MAVAGASLPSSSLYVGDLDPSISDSDLIQSFSAVGPVVSVRVCRDSISKASLGYGYVNFLSPSDASKALESLNHTQLKGKQMRIMWSFRDPLSRKSGVANLFVNNLDLSIDSAALRKIFGKFGNILSCKVADENGNNKGFGFVQFDSEEAAQSAVEALHGSLVYGKKIYVSKFVKKTEKQSACEETKFTNLYVKNLENGLTDDLLREKFSVFGKIISAVVMKDDYGKSRGFGFVSFELPKDAKKAMEAMNGAQLGSKNLYVGRAQKKAEREQMLSCQFKGLNVYVKNLVDSVDDNELCELFSTCGKISSAKVMLNDEGLTRGFGFVSFFTPADAEKAISTFHGTIVHGKPLYVAIAQRKEDRQAILQHQYAKHMAALPCSFTSKITPSSYSVNCHPPPMSALSQINPYQPIICQDFGRSPSILPPRKPIYPTMLSSKQWQTSEWVNELPLLETPQHAALFSYMQPPLHQVNSGKPMKYAGGKNHQEPRCGPFENRKSCFYKSKVKKPTTGPSSKGSEALTKTLSGVAPRQHKKIIGDYLYPLVQEYEYEFAGKITGMLLEMSTSELLALAESRDKLAVRVKSAVEALRVVKPKTGDSHDGDSNIIHLDSPTVN
ncbi:uncharacterized protein LOC131222729 [Magnolia sinica]|uniref:uncharacterized protein LOC131222729 n=1 Tax=Magnolia sinica TaxID=86752 RepID=UPI002658A267|nr:uncharacterized protein LOC131222729 [Magnolia sinica]